MFFEPLYPRATISNWHSVSGVDSVAGSTKGTVKDSPMDLLPRFCVLLLMQFPARSYCQISKPYNLSGLAVAKGSSGTVIAFVPMF